MATPLLSKLGMLAAKVEGTAGTWDAPSAASEAMFRVINLKYTPDIKVTERPTLRADLSRNSHLIGQTLAKLEFSLEFRVTNTAGVADKYGDLLEACGLNETIVASTSTAYNTSSKLADHVTLSMYAWIGGSGPSGSGMRVGMRGAMGSVKFEGKVGEPLMMHFSFMGVGDRDHADMKPQVAAMTTGITHESGVPPIFQAATFTWGGVSQDLTNEFSLDMGTQVVAREDITSQEGVLHYMATGRTVSGSFSPELTLSGGANHLEQLNLGSEVAISCVLIHTGARTLTISVPKAQLTGVQPSERNGIATWGCTFAANANSGDDEVTLTII